MGLTPINFAWLYLALGSANVRRHLRQVSGATWLVFGNPVAADLATELSTGRRRQSMSSPLGPAAVQDGHVLTAVQHGQRPPGARRVLHVGAVVDDDRRLLVDTEATRVQLQAQFFRVVTRSR